MKRLVKWKMLVLPKCFLEQRRDDDGSRATIGLGGVNLTKFLDDSNASYRTGSEGLGAKVKVEERTRTR